MSLTHTKGATVRRHAVTVLAAMLCAWTAAGAQVTTSTTAPRPGTPRIRIRCDGCSDSTRARQAALFLKFDSLRNEFDQRRMTPEEREAMAREMTATLMALQEFMNVQIRSGDMREMRVDVERSNAPAAAVAGGSRPRVSSFAYTPERFGYIGVTFAGPMLKDEGVQRIVRFLAYPEIATVDPSSPAERGGIVRGDTLLALNGTDVLDRTFSFTSLLVPDSRITLKVRREGNAKEFRVVVGEAPAYVVRRMMTPEPPMSPDAPGAAVPVAPQMRARAPSPARETPISPQGLEATTFAFPGRVLFIGNGVAGARLESVTEGLGKNLGVKEGVLVVRVSPGSPADRWGFRDGDVILTAGGEAMRTVQDFQRLVADGFGADGVKVVVLREQKKHDLVLK